MARLPTAEEAAEHAKDDEIIQAHKDLLERRGIRTHTSSGTDVYRSEFYKAPKSVKQKWVRRAYIETPEAFILLLGLNPELVNVESLKHSGFTGSGSVYSDYLLLEDSSQGHRLFSTRDSQRLPVRKISLRSLSEWVAESQIDRFDESPVDSEFVAILNDYVASLPPEPPTPQKLTNLRSKLLMGGDARAELDDLLNTVSEERQEGCLQILIRHEAKSGPKPEYTAWLQEILFILATGKSVERSVGDETKLIVLTSFKSAARYIDEKYSLKSGTAYRRAKSALGSDAIKRDAARIHAHLFKTNVADPS